MHIHSEACVLDSQKSHIKYIGTLRNVATIG